MPDLRNVPMYPIAEAARIIQATPAMLRHWNPELKLGGLNFLQLVESYLIQSLRSKHRLSTRAIRKAVSWLRKHTGKPYPLATEGLLLETDGKSLFLGQFDGFTNATEQGQIAWREILGVFLHRVEYDEEGIASRFYPFTRGYRADNPRFIIVDPRYNFGRPCLASRAISTAIIARRHKAGESPMDLAKDYRCEPIEIDEAIRAEQPQLAA
jgi:uncharacterized protein (DUF433 family)